MIVFKNGLDYRTHEVTTPTVARYEITSDITKFIVIGAKYGALHKLSGGLKTWKSYSGARRAANKYKLGI